MCITPSEKGVGSLSSPPDSRLIPSSTVSAQFAHRKEPKQKGPIVGLLLSNGLPTRLNVSRGPSALHVSSSPPTLSLSLCLKQVSGRRLEPFLPCLRRRRRRRRLSLSPPQPPYMVSTRSPPFLPSSGSWEGAVRYAIRRLFLLRRRLHLVW